MSNIPFAAPTLLRIVAESLPQDDTQPLKNPQDAIAIFTHACMLSVGFRLAGLSEDDRIELPEDESKSSPLPAGWNSGNGSYGFRYTHAQSSMQYLVKVNRLGVKTVVIALGVGDDKTTSFDVVTRDFTSESFFPYTRDTKKLEDGFISENRIADLASLVKINIIQKLVPGLSKPGYEEERGSGASGVSSARQQPRPDNEYQDPQGVPRPYGGPYGPEFPRGQQPPIPDGGERIPGFDDDYEILQQPRGFGFSQGGRNPLSIGADDLNPPGLGPNPPLRGPFFGEGGGGMGGMHPSPDHPMFGGGGDGGLGGSRAPPGSRYDPVGPGDLPPTGGLRGPRGPQGGPGPYNPFNTFGGNDFL